jgi:hypothetical protein
MSNADPKPPRHFVIRHNNGTYFRGYTAIGPSFGGTLDEAPPFATEYDAMKVIMRDWRMEDSKPEEIAHD